MTLEDQCVYYNEMYLGFLAAGFDADQALQLTGVALQAGIMARSYGAGH